MRMARGIQPSEAHDANEVEHTEVRARNSVDKVRSPETLEAKLERAREVFEQLADEDPRTRLLQVAMLRRDEVLLDALLRRIDSSPR